MLIANRFIYLELQKTGCSHTRKILQDYPSIKATVIGKHNTYQEVEGLKSADFDSKLKVGNIRNPWDWYVSLWAFGCMKRGNIYTKTVEKAGDFLSFQNIRFSIRELLRGNLLYQNAARWAAVYEDHQDKNQFREWLKMVLKEPHLFIGGDYSRSRVSTEIGLLTYRYIKLFTREGQKFVKSARTFDDVLLHDGQNNFLDIVIRNESIQEDLLNNAKKMGLVDSELRKIYEQLPKRTNASKRLGYHHYYDEKSIQLVAEADRMLIEKYGYKF